MSQWRKVGVLLSALWMIGLPIYVMGRRAALGKSQLLLPNEPANEANRRVVFENANYAQAAAPTVPSPKAPAATPPSARPVTSGPAARPAAPASSSSPENDGL